MAVVVTETYRTPPVHDSAEDIREICRIAFGLGLDNPSVEVSYETNRSAFRALVTHRVYARVAKEYDRDIFTSSDFCQIPGDAIAQLAERLRSAVAWAHDSSQKFPPDPPKRP